MLYIQPHSPFLTSTEHALSSCHLPHQDDVNPKETVFSQLVLYSLSSLSAHLPQSPLRSCPCIYIHTHIHMEYEDRHTTFWYGSVYLCRGNVGWEIFLWPSLENTTCHSSKTSWAMNSEGTSLWSASALFLPHTKILKKVPGLRNLQSWPVYPIIERPQGIFNAGFFYIR